MTGRTVSNGRNDGNSADVDFDSILPGKITYTVKWRERGSLKHFFLTCPCCGEVSAFIAAQPLREDILNPGDVPGDVMPKDDREFATTEYGDPVICCKKCKKLFFNRYVRDPAIFPKPKNVIMKNLRKCLPAIWSCLAVTSFFAVCYPVLILGWSPAELLGDSPTPEQQSFLETCGSFVFILLYAGVVYTLAIVIQIQAEKLFFRLKSLSFSPETPGYLKFLCRMGVAVPEKILDDMRRKDPENAPVSVPGVPNYTVLPDGKRLYLKRHKRCSCCGAGLCSSGDFSLRLGRTIRVCPECREEYYDPDYLEISREKSPRETYAEVREASRATRKFRKIMYLYAFLFVGGLLGYFLLWSGAFDSPTDPDNPFPEFSLVMYMTVYIFLVVIFWDFIRDGVRVLLETAYPEKRFSEWLKASEKRLRDPAYALKYELGRKTFDAGLPGGAAVHE